MTCRLCLVVLSLALTPTLTLSAADWPQWRGPNRDGVAPGAKLPARWPAEPPAPLWKAPVGEGYSGPAVAGGKVFILGRVGGNERGLCFDADTGRRLWMVEYPEEFQPPDPSAGKGPNATPTVDKDRAYMLGLGGMFHCVEVATGNVLWKHDCRKEYWGVKFHEKLMDDAWFPPCGCATAPLADGDTVIVAVGGEKAGAFTGFDRDTGKIVWKALDDRSSYASPLIVSPGGVKQIVGFTGTRMVGLRYADRELLWEVPFKAMFEQTIVTPVAWKDLVVIGGEGRATFAVRVTETGGKVKVEEAWKCDDLKTYLTTPVAFDDHLVGHDGRTGKLVCISLADGQVAWQSPRVPGKYHSIVVAGGAVLVLNSEGELFAFKADTTECVQLAKWTVAGKGTWSHLAVAGNRLYVKDKEELYCYELK